MSCKHLAGCFSIMLQVSCDTYKVLIFMWLRTLAWLLMISVNAAGYSSSWSPSSWSPSPSSWSPSPSWSPSNGGGEQWPPLAGLCSGHHHLTGRHWTIAQRPWWECEGVLSNRHALAQEDCEGSIVLCCGPTVPRTSCAAQYLHRMRAFEAAAGGGSGGGGPGGGGNNGRRFGPGYVLFYRSVNDCSWSNVAEEG